MSINKILSALADDTRRAIIMKLREGKISTGDLADHIGITPQALSYHLSKLKKADIIYETKYKNYIYYELNLSVLGELIVWLDALKGEKNDENNEN
ncbi:MAG: winged helix-turn-helix transcriptional regulator [Ruminococcus sp.]|nr:winged helix-turn-helix transcriptional regulator [Ruminococcus sp.]